MWLRFALHCLQCLGTFEQDPQKVEWIAQGPFLYSSEGRESLDVIYQRDGVITPAVEEEVVEARF